MAKGIRRVTARRRAQSCSPRCSINRRLLDDLAAKLNCKADELPQRVDSLHDEVKKLNQQLKKGAAHDLADLADQLFAAATSVNGAKLIVGEVPAAPVDAIRSPGRSLAAEGRLQRRRDRVGG